MRKKERVNVAAALALNSEDAKVPFIVLAAAKRYNVSSTRGKQGGKRLFACVFVLRIQTGGKLQKLWSEADSLI